MRAALLPLCLLLCGPSWAAGKKGSLETFKLKSGGYERVYRVYAPGNLAGGKKYPLILLLHGGGGTGRGMPRLTRGGFEALADKHGAILAYPDGLDKNWNDYRADPSRKAQRENIDDVAFLTGLLDEVSKKYPIDAARVYAAGISNGAMMSYTLACRAAQRFAAVAAVAGSIPENLAADCRPARPVPVLMINGTEDKLVHWGGGDVTGPFGARKFGRVLPVEKSRDFWLQADSCDAARKETAIINPRPDDGVSAARETYRYCAGDAAVELIRIEGGGHTWPGGLQYRSERVIGKTSREVDANAEIWNFFMKHPLPAVPGAAGKTQE